MELCDPCGSLGRRLATANLSAPQVVERFMGRGGLRAEVVEGGELRVGDSLMVID